jgi:hypothetical protein
LISRSREVENDHEIEDEEEGENNGHEEGLHYKPIMGGQG